MHCKTWIHIKPTRRLRTKTSQRINPWIGAERRCCAELRSVPHARPFIQQEKTEKLSQFKGLVVHAGRTRPTRPAQTAQTASAQTASAKEGGRAVWGRPLATMAVDCYQCCGCYSNNLMPRSPWRQQLKYDWLPVAVGLTRSPVR